MSSITSMDNEPQNLLEQSLQQNTTDQLKKIRSALRALRDAVILLNEDDSLEWWNQSAQELLSLQPEDKGKSIFDFIELTPEYGIFEIPIREIWINKSIAQVDIRRKHHINILAIKTRNDLKPLPGSDYTFQRNDHIVVIENLLMSLS